MLWWLMYNNQFFLFYFFFKHLGDRDLKHFKLCLSHTVATLCGSRSFYIHPQTLNCFSLPDIQTYSHKQFFSTLGRLPLFGKRKKKNSFPSQLQFLSIRFQGFRGSSLLEIGISDVAHSLRF